MVADGPEFLSPAGAIEPTGPWSLGVRAGDFVFVAGMRGIDPATNTLVEGDEARVRQAFLNMRAVVAVAGGGLRDAVRLVVYVIDMDRHRPLVNQIQEELWGGPPLPTADNRGSEPAEPGRHRRGRRNLLLPSSTGQSLRERQCAEVRHRRIPDRLDPAWRGAGRHRWLLHQLCALSVATRHWSQPAGLQLLRVLRSPAHCG